MKTIEQEDGRPDPDALLAQVREMGLRPANLKEEGEPRRGHLKIYLGMCPGVGKTYSMLQNARLLQTQGMEVLVGVAETHGREETQALLEGLPILPRKKIVYRDTELEEMDLDGLLKAKPNLALVDELAHTNAPGSRHPKRYQDVRELLAAGINVHTTLNVQHLESLTESVQQITGVRVRETVPDRVMDEADEVELVDLGPSQLLRRLEEGKVYTEERASLAAERFFRESNLRALRELAVRKVGDWLNRDLRTYMTSHRLKGPSHTRARLLVAVGPSPFSERLVRETRRLAASMNATWIALHIDTGIELTGDTRRRMNHSLNLARNLGAEVLKLAHTDLTTGMLEVAQSEHVSHLVIGKPVHTGFFSRLFRRSLADQLLRKSGEISLLMVHPQEHQTDRSESGINTIFFTQKNSLNSRWKDYAYACGIAAGTGIMGFLTQSLLSYQLIPLLFLLAISLAGMFLSRGALFFLALISALTWNFFFTQPLYTFQMFSPEDVLHMMLFFAVALTTGQLTARIRARENAWRKGEARAQALYKITGAVSASRNFEQAVQVILLQIDTIFGAPSALLTLAKDDSLLPHPHSKYEISPKEMSVAQIAHEQSEIVGHGTDTLPQSEALHFPLVSGSKSWGVLSVKVPKDADWSPLQRDLLETIVHHLALVLEKETLIRVSQDAEVSRRSESLQRALLDNVSHELKTPLAVIQSCQNTLQKRLLEQDVEPGVEDILDDLKASCARLTRVVNRLLDMSRLESGLIHPQMEWCDATDLFEELIDEHRSLLKKREITVKVPSNLPSFMADPRLLSVALGNLLDNAVTHTPSQTRIELGAALKDGTIDLWVADNGPGLESDDPSQIFRRFSRQGDQENLGLGLGLSITQSFVEAQGGELFAEKNTPHGARFVIRLHTTTARFSADAQSSSER